MSNYYAPQTNYPPNPNPSAQNLQFYQSSYSPSPAAAAAAGQPSSGGGYGYQASGSGGYASSASFAGGYGVQGNIAAGGVGGVSGRMGEQAGLRTGWLAAFSTEGYDGEPPLLEELGVNFGHIQTKTLAVLNPFKHIDQHLMDDSDLAGPVLFFFLFGTFLLFSGKVHFGYIYGLALLGSLSLHSILSLMSPDDHPSASPTHGYDAAPPAGPGPSHGHLSSTLTLARSTSVLGYCLLPLVLTSLLGVVMPMDRSLGIALTTVTIVWCTYSASGIFCAVGRMRGMRALVAYPLALFYVGFGIMGVFSSRGSGVSVSGAT